MVERLIELSARHKWVVFSVTLVLTLWAVDSVRKTPLDALPDTSDPQVIVFTEWMGRSPDLVEDQITYPLVRTLQSTPGVVAVRGYSMFGMSFTYALFGEGTDVYWARTRVLEQLGRVQQQLPPGVAPTLGPAASGVGWVYQYVLKDASGQMGAALSTTDAGFRLRYESRREVAPYLGLTWNNQWGKTADFAEAAGENTGGARLVTGLRVWF